MTCFFGKFRETKFHISPPGLKGNDFTQVSTFLLHFMLLNSLHILLLQQQQQLAHKATAQQEDQNTRILEYLC